MKTSCASDEFRLIDLVSGLLSAEETEATIEHVRNCPGCEQRLREIAGDREFVRAAPFPRMVNNRIQRAQPNSRPGLRRWLAMAAVLSIVALGALRITDSRDPPEYWIPIDDQSVVLRSQVQGLMDMQDGLKAYLDQDADAAIEQLGSLTISSDDGTAMTLRDLYLASALVNSGRHDEALARLDKLGIESMPAPWRGHAQWVQYVALMRAGRDKEALAVIEALAGDPGDTGERARIELDRRK